MSKPKAELTPVNDRMVPILKTVPGEASESIRSLIDAALFAPQKARTLVQVSTNIDPTTFEGKALLSKASAPADYKLKGEEPLFMMVVAYAFFPDSGVDEATGEVREFTRTVLYDCDGLTFRTTAAHAPMRLLITCGLFTPLQWMDGIPFVIRQKVGDRGRPYHSIELDTSARFKPAE